MKIEIFLLEKVKLGTFSTESEKNSEIGGIWNRGKCIIVSGWMDAPVYKGPLL